ncbi:Thioredoxin, nucleoredoxin [Phytophthora cinnamomi]|uniref:Thioredoxin, nucleoredoxin n=1 Tax=Phytophthora cinnamomi TaxID=4785 RepID=UPI0035595307|nr:Thioredoxin, nucleoredoxin [Phytophthora cinnamomi]
MIKRFAFLLLVVLVAMLSYVHAEDAPAAPAAEDAHSEEVPPGVTMLDREPVPANKEQLEQYIGGGGGFIPTGGITYRWRYTYPYAGGFRYGWRYPIGYWNSFGRSLYGSNCPFGHMLGGFYYC